MSTIVNNYKVVKIITKIFKMINLKDLVTRSGSGQLKTDRHCNNDANWSFRFFLQELPRACWFFSLDEWRRKQNPAPFWLHYHPAFYQCKLLPNLNIYNCNLTSPLPPVFVTANQFYPGELNKGCLCFQKIYEGKIYPFWGAQAFLSWYEMSVRCHPWKRSQKWVTMEKSDLRQENEALYFWDKTGGGHCLSLKIYFATSETSFAGGLPRQPDPAAAAW